jgi:hypothetical protein
MIVMVAVAAAAVAGDRIVHHWSPHVRLETEHYRLLSSATEEQTREIGRVAEIVYAGYLRLLDDLQWTPPPHPGLQIRLFKDREEFRRCNRVHDWAEAFYIPPICYQYFSADEANPYHWMMHEATHQLNREVAGFRLMRWLDEGLACYVGTSRIVDDSLRLGEIDTNTYPIWWIGSVEPSGDLEADKRNTGIIPLRALVSGKGGPSMNEYFNLYYVHWWSLVHFLRHYESGKYRPVLGRLAADGGGLDAFEKDIGPIDSVEKEWYAYLPELLRQVERATPDTGLKSAP